MSNILKLVLTDHWFEEIKSGRKTHEYRMATLFWYRRIDFFRDNLLYSERLPPFRNILRLETNVKK